MTMFYNTTHKCLPHHASFSVPCSTQGRSINVPLSGRRLATAKLLMYRRRCCTLIVIFFFLHPPTGGSFLPISVYSANFLFWHLIIHGMYLYRHFTHSRPRNTYKNARRKGFFCTHYLLTFINVSAFVVLSQELNCTHSKML